MRVHRSAHARHFTVLPNGLLQDRRLSYTARGLLADLLSRPDGRREDGRHMADSSPQGRGAVRRALKELTSAGYYRVDILRLPDGTLRSEAHVYDTPQLAEPGVTRPDPGGATTGAVGVLSVKNPVQEPSLPAGPPTGEPPGGAAEPEGRPVGEQVRTAAVLTLFRAIRPEPRLRLGAAEAQELAPLVAQWLERGSTTRELAQALLPGLPAVIHSPAAVLRSRLTRKMPPVRASERPPARAYAECTTCHDPVPQPGDCRACSGLGARTPKVGGGAAAAASGAPLARAALLAARAAGPAHAAPAPQFPLPRRRPDQRSAIRLPHPRLPSRTAADCAAGV
ncbi:hypothetical protein ACIQGZ_14430 [Streptomyces sp. NPDC092296]|uniref:hypothetical protein n=1 Tax=Streptomyces sp. NPDC092296 TaxID=3366012 RepID=UPI0037F4BEE3